MGEEFKITDTREVVTVRPAPGYLAVEPVAREEENILVGKIAMEYSSPYSDKFLVRAVGSAANPVTTFPSHQFHIDIGDVVLADFGNAVTAEHDGRAVKLIRFDQVVAKVETVTMSEGTIEKS